jgi:hypothetical protein
MDTQVQQGDFIAAMRQDIQVRIRELQPILEEMERLKAAERALDATEPVKRRGRPKGSKNKTAA